VSSGVLRFVENAAAKQFHGGVAAAADDVGGVAVNAEGAFDRRPQQQRPEVRRASPAHSAMSPFRLTIVSAIGGA
ncbi:MAG: hypothetical protein WBE66_03890, partial [Mycobacterium sp.]